MQKSQFWRLKQWIHTGYRMPAQKIIFRPENHWKSVTYLALIRSKSIIVPRSWTSTNWNEFKRRINSKCAALSHMVIECDNVEWHQRLRACFLLVADIVSTCCNKDDVMWHAWLFWDTITASHVIVCCYSVNPSNVHLFILLTSQSDAWNLPR